MSLRASLVMLAALTLAGCGDARPEVDAVEPPPVPTAPSLEPLLVRVAARVAPTTTVTEAESNDGATEAKETIPWASASISDRKPPASNPVGLAIDSLGIDAEVVGMGVDDRGQMQVPGNVSDVAWYRFGASPGEDGSAVLAAHVDMAGQGPGIFFDVDSLRPNDEVIVHFDDGSTRTFVVVGVERVAKADLDVGALFAGRGESVVYLVTCGGAFNPQIRRYNDNVVVTLIPAAES